MTPLSLSISLVFCPGQGHALRHRKHIFPFLSIFLFSFLFLFFNHIGSHCGRAITEIVSEALHTTSNKDAFFSGLKKKSPSQISLLTHPVASQLVEFQHAGQRQRKVTFSIATCGNSSHVLTPYFQPEGILSEDSVL